MAEGHKSQELAIPSKRKGGIAQRVQDMLRRPAVQTITKTPQAIEKTPIEQTPGEMSLERARKILEFIVNIPERGLDDHERKLTPAKQYKRFGGVHYKDIKQAFGVYADHLVATHEKIEVAKHRPDIKAVILKEGLPGPLSRNSSGARYYDLMLSIKAENSTGSRQLQSSRRLRLILSDSTRDGDRPREVRVDSQIPLGHAPESLIDEAQTNFYDGFSHPDPHDRGVSSASLSGLGRSVKEASERREYNQWFHTNYQTLHQGMRWTAANLLCWDENRIVYPADLDKSPLALDRGQTQLNQPKLELLPKQ